MSSTPLFRLSLFRSDAETWASAILNFISLKILWSRYKVEKPDVQFLAFSRRAILAAASLATGILKAEAET
jgi:hypothetical protein